MKFSRFIPRSIVATGVVTSLLGFALPNSAQAQAAVFSYTGAVQTFAIPANGFYNITVYGAQGGGSESGGNGGLGAVVSGDLLLTSGTTLDIVVGGAGGGFFAGGGSGGGGSFVFSPGFTTLYAVAGGGGGALRNDGGGGLAGTSGGSSSTGGAGGTNGSGGSAGSADGSGGGGAGWLTSGSNGGGSNSGSGGSSQPTFGGGGGGFGASGGFGGGGGNGGSAGGGGGGYSGGNGGIGGSNPGGGGGSFLADSAADPVEMSGVQSGNGLVKITPLGVISGVVQGSVIVAKGDAVPGVPAAKFLLANSPAVDSVGDVAFKAFISGTSTKSGIGATNDAGVWLYTGTVGTLLARTGTSATAPGTTGTTFFSSLSDPLIHPSGSVAYAGTLKGGDVTKTKTNSTGVWLEQNGSTNLLARQGSAAPNQTGANFAQFEQVVTEAPASVAFLAKLTGTGVKPATNLALFGEDTSHVFHTVVRTGQSLTTGTVQRTVKSINVFGLSADEKGQSRSIDPLNGHLAFGLGFTDKSTAIAIATQGSSGFTLDSVAEISGTAAPGVPSGAWSAFGNPVVNSDGAVAFRGTLKSTSASVKVTAANNAGIWLDTSSDTLLVARTSGTAPGTNGALFATLQDPVLNDDGQIAFIGSLHTAKNLVAAANSAGIWATTSGTLRNVARTGSSVPVFSGTVSSTATFAGFQQVVLPQGAGPIFTATLKGTKAAANNGIWSVDSTGAIHLVAQTGNVITVNGVVRTIKSLSIFTVVPQVSGQSRNFDASSRNVAFFANFTDKTWAIIQAIAP